MNKNYATGSSITAEDMVFNQIIQSCSNAKGMDLLALDVSQVSSITDKFIIVSGRSDRHVMGITNRIIHDLADHKVKPDNMEGYDKAHWVLLDFSDIIVHVFYQPQRELYNLEELWDKGEIINIDDLLRSFDLEDREAA